MLGILHHPNLNPVIFTLWRDAAGEPVLALRWYGLMYVFAFVFGFFVFRWLQKIGYLRMKAEDVTSVIVYGVIGTALIQAMLALFGFWLLAVPQPFLLATCVIILGLFPVAGSSLVWIPVAIWQLMTGQIVAGIIMGVYGALIIGGVDNFLKPYLISRGSQMPFLLVFFGVIGGVVTFGILGIFLGPMLLALGLSLTREWLQLQAGAPAVTSARIDGA